MNCIRLPYFFKGFTVFPNARIRAISTRLVVNSEERPQPNTKNTNSEAAKVAMQSLKDIGSLFSIGASDPDTQPINTSSIYENPKLFGELSLLHQGQVLRELQAAYDKNWNFLSPQQKKLGYFIAYGNWGAREGFDNWNKNDPPYDLPFKIPSQLVARKPSKESKVSKLEPTPASEIPVRSKQFTIKKLDSVTRTFLYIALFITMLAIYRDKNIGEEGKPVEFVVEDYHEKARQERLAKEQAEEDKSMQEGGSQKSWWQFWKK